MMKNIGGKNMDKTLILSIKDKKANIKEVNKISSEIRENSSISSVSDDSCDYIMHDTQNCQNMQNNGYDKTMVSCANFSCLDGMMNGCLEIPRGWEEKFAAEMCQELQNFYDSLSDEAKSNFFIYQIKEKYADLCIYYSCRDEDRNKMREITEKYEKIAEKTCECCGAEAEFMTTSGWWTRCCAKCKDEYLSNDKFTRLKQDEKA